MNYEIHPFALIFAETFDEPFVEDIRTNGLRVPIVLYNNLILDGRQRYKACLQADVQPHFIASNSTTDDEAWAEVLSYNVHRRENSIAQRAWAASEWANLKLGSNQYTSLLHSSRDERIPEMTRKDAAKYFNISTASLDRMKAVRQYAPAIVADVLRGEPSLKQANEMAQKNRATFEAQEKFIAEENARRAAEKAARDREEAEWAAAAAQAASRQQPASSSLNEQEEARKRYNEARAAVIAAQLEEAQKAKEAQEAKEASDKAAHEALLKETSEAATQARKAKAEKEKKEKEAERIRLAHEKLKKKQDKKLNKANKVKPEPKPVKKPEPAGRLGLTREQVDPEFKGTDMEFFALYGHVWLKTAEQIARERFDSLASHIELHGQANDRYIKLEDIDLNWLRSPNSKSIDKLERYLPKLEILVKKAREALEVAKKSAAANDDTQSHEMDLMQNTQA